MARPKGTTQRARYNAAKAAYHREGQKLGKITHKKSR